MAVASMSDEKKAKIEPLVDLPRKKKKKWNHASSYVYL
jgi:hypothetical protein